MSINYILSSLDLLVLFVCLLVGTLSGWDRLTDMLTGWLVGWPCDYLVYSRMNNWFVCDSFGGSLIRCVLSLFGG